MASGWPAHFWPQAGLITYGLRLAWSLMATWLAYSLGGSLAGVGGRLEQPAPQARGKQTAA